MSAPPTLTVLSLGGGLQSSVMALMAGEGLFDRAIVADTRRDPRNVCVHWLGHSTLPYP